MSVILVACNSDCKRKFEIVKNALTEAGIEAEIVHPSGADFDYSGKKFALVGIMGTQDDRMQGLQALQHIAKPLGSCAVGIFCDASGFKWYGMQRGSISRERMRMGVFTGSSYDFPHANALVRVKGQMVFATGGDLQPKLEEIVQAIRDNFCRRLSF